MKPILTVTLNPSVDKTVTLPTLQVGGLNRIATVRTDPGGKGVNVARVLGRFGAPVTAAGLLAGNGGDYIEAQLKAEGATPAFVCVQGETRINLKVKTADGSVTELNERGFAVSEKARAAFERQFVQQATGCGTVVLAGSLPPSLPEDYYARLIGLAKAVGCRVILDADGVRLKAGLAERPFAVKPNATELSELVGQPLTTPLQLKTALEMLRADGVALAVVSLGKDGALFCGADGTLWARPFPIVCRGTVGAGDSLVAGLCWALENGFSAADTAAFAVAAGSLSAEKEGTEVCSRAEVESRYRAVTVTAL